MGIATGIFGNNMLTRTVDGGINTFFWNQDKPILSWENGINALFIASIPLTGGLSLAARGALGAGKTALLAARAGNAALKTTKAVESTSLLSKLGSGGKLLGRSTSRGVDLLFKSKDKDLIKVLDAEKNRVLVTGGDVSGFLAKGDLPKKFNALKTVGALSLMTAAKSSLNDHFSVAGATTRIGPDDKPIIEPTVADTRPTGGLVNTFNNEAGNIFDKAAKWVDEMGGDFIGPDAAKLVVGVLGALSSMFVGGQIGGWKGLAMMGAMLATTYAAATGSKTSMNWDNVGLGDVADFGRKYFGDRTGPAAVLGS